MRLYNKEKDREKQVMTKRRGQVFSEIPSNLPFHANTELKVWAKF